MLELPKVAYVFLLPLLGGAILSGLCVKYGWLSSFARPIDSGRTLRGRRIFGANKIYAAIISAALGNAIVLGLQIDWLHRFAVFRSLELVDYGTVNGWLLGLVEGLLASFSELPNSFVKRQLDVVPGQLATGAWGSVFYFVDQVDSALGAWIGLSFVIPATLDRIVSSVVLLFFGHQLVTVVGYALGMRKNPH
jgi:hypothetical protein